MKKILLVLLAFCLEYLPAYANEELSDKEIDVIQQQAIKSAELPEGIVEGIFKGTIKSNTDGYIIVKLITGSGLTYLETPSAKAIKGLKIGNKYEFYPVIAKANDFKKIKGMTIPVLYFSYGLIDKKYKQQARFSFNDLKMGETIPDNLDNFKSKVAIVSPDATVSLINNHANVKDSLYFRYIDIKNYAVADMLFDVTISSDYYGKLSSFASKSVNKSSDQIELLKKVEVMCRIIKQKYNLADDEDYIAYPKDLKKNVHASCLWRYGWLQALAGYKVEEGNSVVFATIEDVQRNAQAEYIAKGAQKNLETEIEKLEKRAEKEYVEEEMKKYIDNRDKNINDGLKSF